MMDVTTYGVFCLSNGLTAYFVMDVTVVGFSYLSGWLTAYFVMDVTSYDVHAVVIG